VTGKAVTEAEIPDVESTVRSVLSTYPTWAVVGCSPDPERDSHRVARYLQSRGYRVIPVNPRATEILGERCYAKLADIPIEENVEVVDLFRRSDRAGSHVDEAIEIGARAVWMQLGVIDAAAATRARSAGLEVVMDRCPAIELPRLGVEAPSAEGNGSRAEHSNWRAQVLEVHQGRNQTIRTYSRLAPLYEIWARLTESRPRRRVLELAAVRDGEAVLEVATGTGVQLVALARRNPSGRTAGVELAEGMLARTGRRLADAGLDRVELRRGDALDLPFADESFDLVVNSYMLDLLPRDDIPRALKEFRRVLKPRGRLVLSNMTKGGRPLHRIWDKLYERGINLTANCRGVLAAPVLSELGFVDIGREYIAQMLFPTEVVSAQKPG
jgi:predicted CoA-binding protein/ubiquinone/menaquinone biosynthesis C-methylase UbiE